MFTDRTTLRLKAGKGGNGIVAWHRSQHQPKGGPAGGNGGRGGCVILKANLQHFSLEKYRRTYLLAAENGKDGGPNCRQGGQGSDLYVEVPCGTLVKEAQSGNLLYDLTADGEEFLICHGGKGGMGNDYFKTPTRRSPNFATKGNEGEEIEVELELKLIADVGLVGYPNAGKSTLLNALTDAPTKIGSYPFTTLHPQIGFIKEEGSGERIYLADIPGIIEGAHANRGLGLDFLRHIERTKILLYLIDLSGVDGRNPIDDFAVLQSELGAYDPNLLKRSHCIALNKMDEEVAKENFDAFCDAHPQEEENLFPISALTGEGLESLIQRIQALHFSSK